MTRSAHESVHDEEYLNKARRAVAKLLATDFGRLPPEKALEYTGTLVDLAHDLRDLDALKRAVERVVQTRARADLSDGDRTLLFYQEGNAWTSIQRTRVEADMSPWAWEDAAAQAEIIALRCALRSLGYASLAVERKCQILTNLGNAMSRVGRFVEALRYYERALRLDPSFAMARANKGQSMYSYATGDYDDGHGAALAGAAVEFVSEGVRESLDGPEATHGFQLLLAEMRSHAPADFDRHRLEGHSLGKTRGEQAFRRWALEETLFLNTLNDIGPVAAAARDMLQLPAVALPSKHGTEFHGFFNQLKREFATARRLLYEATTQSGLAYTDRDLCLTDTMDGAAFDLATENLKLSLRVSYSLLDKASVFLALYFNLAKPLHRVNIRSVWYGEGAQKAVLLPLFEDRRNWPLRGLFWLSKDLFEQEKSFHDALEPEAQRVATIRNRSEHGYLKVVRDDSGNPGWVAPDPLAERVTTEELKQKALEMLRRSRAALIYLTLAIHAEEQQRPKVSARLSLPMRLELLEDI